MWHYSQEDIEQAFHSIGLKQGDLVFSHSNIGFFGIPKEGKTAKIASQIILDAFFNVIGEQGTLVVPTFTYSFPQGKIFDPDHSPSDCGVLTEFLRNKPEAFRSNDPAVSVVAIGCRAEEMTQNATENSYAKDSFFGRFYNAKGVICNLNFDAGSTFIHFVERKLQVPYRFDKQFEGYIKKNTNTRKIKSTLWVRSLSMQQTEAKFELFDNLARMQGIYRVAPVGRGFVGMMSAEATYQLIEETLLLQPDFLTEKGQVFNE